MANQTTNWTEQTPQTEQVSRPVHADVRRCVFLVFGEHNRHGAWLAGVYDNESAALDHKKYLDDTTNGWENISGGEVRPAVVASKFSIDGN